MRPRLHRYHPAMQLVLLHALPLDGRMWDAVQSILSDTFAPTLYELGGSVQEWAHAILDECSDEELLVVGNSVGGSCALEVIQEQLQSSSYEDPRAGLVATTGS